MSNPLHTNDLEIFLQKEAGNHRMYPADKIWRNIQKEIHGEGRWPALTFVSIFIISALVVCTLMVKPEERMHKNTIVYSTQKEVAVSKTKSNTKDAVAATPVQNAYTETITQQTLQQVSKDIIARSQNQTTLQPLALTQQSLFLIENKPAQTINETALATTKITKQEAAIPTLVEAAQSNKLNETATQLAVAKPVSNYFSSEALLNVDVQKQPAYDLSSFYNIDDIWRNFPLLHARDVLRRKLSHLSFELYITPSVSYRELNSANGKAARSYAAIAGNSNYQLDENHSAKHLPALGAEIGFALGYKLSNALTLKGGLQLNMRQYGVRTYGTQYNNTPDARTVNTVNNALPGNDIDDATASSNVVAGTKLQTFYNRYYQVAAPVGIDWRVFTSDNGRLTVHTAFAVQPTYTFDKPSFVISTGPKSFVDGSSILRNWNVNSAAEAYVSYKMGAFRWQIGPQVRYQHLSTFSSSYPVREHLIDYGVKIGLTKSLD